MDGNNYSANVNKMYFTVAECSAYTGISIRKLREFLTDSTHPLPHYRVGSAGRIIRISKTELEQWLQRFKVQENDLNIDLLIRELNI